MNKKNVRAFVIAFVAVVAIGFVSNGDFKEDVNQQLTYCENVKAGAWPDYNKSYDVECSQARVKEYEDILPNRLTLGKTSVE